MLLDTDIGVDFDDALALGWLFENSNNPNFVPLYRPDFVSLYPGTYDQIRYVRSLANMFDVPWPMIVTKGTPSDTLWVNKYHWDKIPSKFHAKYDGGVYYLDSINSNDYYNEIVAIGPLTNVAKLVEQSTRELNITIQGGYNQNSNPNLFPGMYCATAHNFNSDIKSTEKVLYNNKNAWIKVIGKDICAIEYEPKLANFKQDSILATMMNEKKRLYDVVTVIDFVHNVCKYDFGNPTLVDGNKWKTKPATDDCRIKVANKLNIEQFYHHLCGN